MAFLMGLNDSFSQVRTQLLLMEPEPSITRVFSLVAQEVEQRISTDVPSCTVSTNATALLAKNSQSNVASSSRSNSQTNKKKERPHCTHCNVLGHTVDRCYKLHGYPPGYRNQKGNSTPSTAAAKTKISPVPGFTTEQCQILLNMLQSHLTTAKVDSDSPSPSGTAHVAGTCSSLDPITSTHHNWIVDSGASAHICSHIQIQPHLCQCISCKTACFDFLC